MRMPLAVAVRCVGLAGLGLTLAAVWLGRHCSQCGTGTREVRRPATSRYRTSPDLLHDPVSRPVLRLLDAGTGDLVRFPLAGMERISFAACSPWQDGLGRTHVAGLWIDFDDQNIRAMGLARCVLPGALVLDRVELDVLPGGAPCWPPGPGTWVLYPGTDGVLYRLEFDEGASVPRPLAWRCPPPRGSWKGIIDPAWPSDPRLAGTILVALRHIASDDGLPDWFESQLWWLELNADGTAIEGAGRLIAPASGNCNGHEEIALERLPALSATPDGGLVLAYIVRRKGESEYRLRLARVTIDPATRAPRAEPSTVVEVAEGRAPALAAFSADGRWVYSFPYRSPLPGRADRTAVAEALARGDRPTVKRRG